MAEAGGGAESARGVEWTRLMEVPDLVFYGLLLLGLLAALMWARAALR